MKIRRCATAFHRIPISSDQGFNFLNGLRNPMLLTCHISTYTIFEEFLFKPFLSFIRVSLSSFFMF